VRSCVLDGEAIVVDERGVSVFEPLRYRTHDHAAVLCAFDLLELDGADFRSQPLEQRKATLADLLRGVADGIAFNRHFTGDGAMIFKHACALGCEGIVSKRLGSSYRAGRVNYWIKVKNPAAPAVKREAEEDWNGKRWRAAGSPECRVRVASNDLVDRRIQRRMLHRARRQRPGARVRLFRGGDRPADGRCTGSRAG